MKAMKLTERFADIRIGKVREIVRIVTPRPFCRQPDDEARMAVKSGACAGLCTELDNREVVLKPRVHQFYFHPGLGLDPGVLVEICVERADKQLVQTRHYS